MSGQLGMVHGQLKVPFEIDGGIGHFAHKDVGPDAGDVVHQLRLKQQVPSGQEVIGDVVL